MDHRPQIAPTPTGAALPARDESAWRGLAAAGWLTAFFGVFFSQRLPNNAEFTRWDLWSEVPLLLDLVDPPPPSPADAMADWLARNSGWRYFPQRFEFLLIAGAILAGAWGLGLLILRCVQPPLPRRGLERNLFGLAMGLSAVSLTTLACGLIGWLSRPLLGGGLVAVVVAELVLRWKERGEPSTTAGAIAALPPPPQGAALIAGLAAAPFLLCMLLGAMLPSTDFDVNEYHFEGPKEYYQAGRIAFLPHNVYTSFPFGTEMLTLLAMVLRQDWYWGALAGKTLLMSFAPLTALALYAAGCRWFSPQAGLWAAVISLTTPWVYRLSIIAYAEGALGFYLFVALYATGLALQHAQAGEVNLRQHCGAFFLAGLLAGSAMACKYPAALSVVVPLAAAVTVGAFRFDRYRAWRAIVVFAIGVVVVIGPWLGKNLVETGNPVYPLLYGVFGGRDWDAALDARWRHAHSPDNFAPADLADKVLDVTVKSDWLSPLLFGLAPLALLNRAGRRSAWLLWGYLAYLFVTWWVFTHRIDRFWVPMIPVVALLAGCGARWRDGGGHAAAGPAAWAVRPWSIVLPVISSTAVVFNLAFITTGLCGFNAYLLDLNEARQFAGEITAPEIASLNALRLPADARVLCVGGAAVFDAQFPVVYNTVFDHSVFEEWFAERREGVPAAEWPLQDAATLRRRLAEERVTHICVHWREIARYHAPHSYGFSEFVTPQRFADLQRAGVLGRPLAIPEAIQRWSGLPPIWQSEFDTWGKSLKTSLGGQPAVISFQVFPVLVGAENDPVKPD